MLYVPAPKIIKSYDFIDTSSKQLTIEFSQPLSIDENFIKNNNIEIKLLNNNQNDIMISEQNKIVSPQKNENNYTIECAIQAEGQILAGQKYQLQLRWCKKTTPNEVISDWSNPMMLKAINKSEYSISLIPFISANSDLQKISDIKATEPNIMPFLKGTYSESTNSEEAVQYCKIDISAENNKTVSSGWIEMDQIKTGGIIDNKIQYQYQIKEILQEGILYTAIASLKTINGYIKDSSDNPYSFYVNPDQSNNISDFSKLSAEGDSNFCKEEGCINIYATTQYPATGNFVLLRSSEDDGFTKWQDIKTFSFIGKSFNNNLFYRDFFIESGKHYRYLLQEVYPIALTENEVIPNYRTNPFPSTDIPEAQCNFEYCYLCNKERSLKLKFDLNISSFKNIVMESKQNTLGSAYPTIIRNGITHYAEFPISGTISAFMDEQKLFIKDPYELGTDLTNENIYIEKIFREKVEAFLNNGECKLFKSATEGNHLITLMNVSLTPKKELGRMIYSFSATAYEIAENIYENYIDYNLIDKSIDFIDHNSIYYCGPFAVSYMEGENFSEQIINLLKQYKHENDYEIIPQGISSLSIDPQSKINISGNTYITQYNNLILKDIDNIETIAIEKGSISNIIIKYKLTKSYIPPEIESFNTKVFGTIVIQENQKGNILEKIKNQIKEQVKSKIAGTSFSLDNYNMFDDYFKFNEIIISSNLSDQTVSLKSSNSNNLNEYKLVPINQSIRINEKIYIITNKGLLFQDYKIKSIEADSNCNLFIQYKLLCHFSKI